MIFLNRDNAGFAAVCGAIFLVLALLLAMVATSAKAQDDPMVEVPRSVLERVRQEIDARDTMIEGLSKEVLRLQKATNCA